MNFLDLALRTLNTDVNRRKTINFRANKYDHHLLETASLES